MLLPVLAALVAAQRRAAQETVAPNVEARYWVRFQTFWSAENFPYQYPSNAHWSRLVGAPHGRSCGLFQLGQPATAGLKNVAELGDHNQIFNEIAANSCMVNEDRIDKRNPPVAGNRTVRLWLSQAAPVISLVTMIAPSPDWFAGVRADLFAGGTWAESLKLDVLLYDAGTSDRTGYVLTTPAYVTTPAAGVSLVTWGNFGAQASVVGALHVELLETRSAPTMTPSSRPSGAPTVTTGFPSRHPSPPTGFPSKSPTGYPSKSPKIPTGYPSKHPTTPTGFPTRWPRHPTGFPSKSPSPPTGFPWYTTGFPSSGYPSSGFPSSGFPTRTGYPSRSPRVPTGFPSSGFPSSGFPSRAPTNYPTSGGSESG